MSFQRGRRLVPGALTFLAASLVAAGFIFLIQYRDPSPRISRIPVQDLEQPTLVQKAPRSLQELLTLKPAELAGVDIALMNLLCAEGLPGAESLNLEDSLRTLDQWAGQVKSETKRFFSKFQRHPEEYSHSEGYFTMLMLGTVLQQDLNVQYNPERITSPATPEPNHIFFADSRDLFLHGLTGPRRQGTCASLPVLYVAVGRRLGYPLKLVTAKAHLFVRWESADSAGRFNIEVSGRGLSMEGDDHYRNWPYPTTEKEIRSCRYLKSLEPGEALAEFLRTRGHCLAAAGLLSQARQAYLQSAILTPDWPQGPMLLASVERRMRRQQLGWAEEDAWAFSPRDIPPGQSSAWPGHSGTPKPVIPEGSRRPLPPNRSFTPPAFDIDD